MIIINYHSSLIVIIISTPSYSFLFATFKRSHIFPCFLCEFHFSSPFLSTHIPHVQASRSHQELYQVLLIHQHRSRHSIYGCNGFYERFYLKTLRQSPAKAAQYTSRICHSISLLLSLFLSSRGSFWKFGE